MLGIERVCAGSLRNENIVVDDEGREKVRRVEMCMYCVTSSRKFEHTHAGHSGVTNYPYAIPRKQESDHPSRPTLIVQSDYHTFYSSFDPLSSSFCPHTSSSTCSFPPVNFNKIPHTGVNKGTNIETLFLYAPYASGYFDMEILSVKKVEDTKRAQSASDGASGARSCRASLKVVTSGCTRGPVGEDSTGNRVITPYSSWSFAVNISPSPT